MTACVNKNHGRRVAGVVTASLVGALTLGGVSLAAVPTVALAEQGGSLQVAWNDNSVAKAGLDKIGGTVVDDAANASFTRGSGKYLVPTLINNGFEDIDVSDGAKYVYNYYDASGAVVAGYDSTTDANTYFGSNGGAKAGTYFVTVEDKTSGVESAKMPFEVTEAGSGIYAYEGNDESDKTFVYNGKALDINFANASGELPVNSTLSDAVPTSGYNLVFTDGTGHALVDDNYAFVYPTNAGEYTAVLRPASGKEVHVKVTVAKLDLSSLSVTADDVFSTAPEANFLKDLKVGGQDGFGSVLKVKSVTNPNGTTGWLGASDYGKYTVTVVPGDNQDEANVSGSADVEFANVESNLFSSASVFYGEKQAGSNLTVSKADGESFDASKLSVRYADGKVVDPKNYTVSYEDADGNAVEASALAQAGTYTVKVKANAFKGTDGVWVGGSTTFTVTVGGTVTLDSSKNVAWYVDGQVVSGSSKSVTYDGTDALSSLKVVIKDGNGKELSQGTDYTLEVKDGQGKEVTSIVDAASKAYTVTVKPQTFQFGVNQVAKFSLTVSKANLTVSRNLTGSEHQPTSTSGYSVDKDAIVYTGSAIATPGAQFQKVKRDGSLAVDKENKEVWFALGSDLYKVVSLSYSSDNGATYKSVTEAKEAGTYKVKVALTAAGSKNYTLTADTFTFDVINVKPFADVESPVWYAAPVAYARTNGYVNGVGNTGLFAPTADITRSQAIAVLFNMAGGQYRGVNSEFGYNELYGWNTGFSDADGHAWYAQALAWAHNLGIANGYGDGSFAPEAKITREEFAALVANYAKATGKYVAPESDELSKLSDANTVSGWAKDVVNWAVANKVMGNGGFVAGQASITRAEVAAMAVNYQPEKLK